MKQNKSALNEVASLLATDINMGKFLPGTWLKQIELAERYACSRNDVRRALDQLVIERLVQHVPNRGYHVYRLDEKQRNNISEIRAILESAVAKDIIENITAAEFSALEACAQLFDNHVYHGSVLQLFEANIKFHHALLKPCSNKDLIELIFDIRSRVPSAAIGQWKSHARILKSSAEHFAIVEAIRLKDAALLEARIKEHILQVEDRQGSGV
ncbi:transcriptional regulator [Izhakiella australiensis]|uniref:Transcriptional regulator n=1 Tax=Izhakiella australiensis TaxID=1926881 RepID=A0A1S8YSW3_9GAMM|nr:GntR family transcriptional regulator [Izhakiella australiensis]OON41938.1 transcriptional regulator [Izhakiella australiensis]